MCMEEINRLYRRIRDIRCTGPICLVWSGTIAYVILYLFQAIVLVYYMAERNNGFWGFAILASLLSPGYLLLNRCFLTAKTRSRAVRRVWFVWLLYIIFLILSIVVIFSTVVSELKTTDTWGPNALKTVLCITPVLLILLLNTVIPAGNQRFVERLSVTAVLDLFDGMEMLEIILLQKHSTLVLPKDLETCIIAFVSIGFFLSAFHLLQHKVDPTTGEVKIVKMVLFVRTSIQILFVNLTFLGIRCYVWKNYHYDASIFITKNVLSIIVSLVEIMSVFDFCKCGSESHEVVYHV